MFFNSVRELNALERDRCVRAHVFKLGRCLHVRAYVPISTQCLPFSLVQIQTIFEALPVVLFYSEEGGGTAMEKCDILKLISGHMVVFVIIMPSVSC